MRHTFVVQISVDTGDVDPTELMGDVEEVVAEGLAPEAESGHWPELAEADVECVDAWETAGAGVQS